MYNRVKILVLMQLNNKLKRKVGTTKTSILVRTLLNIILLAIITAICYFVLGFLKSPLSIPVDMTLLLFVFFITQILSIISCTAGLTKSLYSSKDNAILLSMPTTDRELFLSKLVTFYIFEFVKGLYFIIPFFLAFGISTGANTVFYLLTIVSIVILPLLPVLIGAILSLPIKLTQKLFNRIPALKFVFIISVVAGVFFVLAEISQALPRPLRILALYGRFVEDLLVFMGNVNVYSLLYSNVINMFYSVNFWYNLLIFSAYLVGFAVLVVFVVMPFFFRIASNSSEKSIRTFKRSKNKTIKKTYLTFLKKEVLITVRDVDQMINNFLFIISLPFVMYILNQIFQAIQTNTLGNDLIIAINILISLLLLTASNTASATALSKEGSEFGLMKTAPRRTANMAWAKITINFMVASLSIIATSIVLGSILDLSALTTFLIFLLLLFVDGGHILWSFQIDLLNPKLREYATTGSLQDNKNGGSSILAGLIISFIIAVVAFFSLREGYAFGWCRIIPLVVGFFVLRLYLFQVNLKVYFQRIEF